MSNQANENPIKCTECGTEIDPLEVFPKNRCVNCHAKAPEVQRETETMTADKLARMWGGR